MKTRKFAATTALLIAAMGVAAGTADAGTTQQPPLGGDLFPGVHYSATDNGKTAVITTDAGKLTVENGAFEIKDSTGKVIAGTPLTLQNGDISLPITAKVSGNTATLSPNVNAAVYHPVDLPFQDSAPWKTPYDREQAAWNRLRDTVTTGSTVGAIVGAVAAGAIGCVSGGALGATGGFAFLAVGAVPGAVIGCLSGAALFAPIGTMAGLAFVAGPVAVAAAVQYFTTINAPFTPAK